MQEKKLASQNPLEKIKSIILQILLPILLIIALAYPAMRDLFKDGYFTSHDGEGHIIRMQEFYNAFADGMFPVRWSMRLYYGYGYPFFNFNYPLVYYAGLPTMMLGYSATAAMEVEMVVTFVLSGIFMYLYLRRKTASSLALAGSVMYMYAPYRLLNVYVRGSVAESAAFIFPPLILWAIEAIAEKRKLSMPWAAIVIALLGLSHNISALLLFAFYFAYALFLWVAKKDWRVFWRSSLAFFLGILMALFFLVPALYEKSYTFLDTTIAKDYPDHFILPVQLVKSGWDFGSSVAGPNDGQSFNLGWVNLALSLLALVLVFNTWKIVKKRSWLTVFFYMLTITLVSLFFMFTPSKILWDSLPLLPFVQFPWRFISLTVPTLSILAVFALELLSHKYGLNKWKQALLAFFVIALTMFFAKDQWRLNQTLFWSNPAGQALLGTTTWADEQATQWLTPRPKTIPAQRIEIINGADPIVIEEWKTHQHQYSFTVSEESKVVEHTMYYPGWRLLVNGQEAEIDYQDQDYPGEIVYKVVPGEYKVTTKLTETTMRSLVNYISLLTTLGVFLWMIMAIFKQKK